MKNVMFGTIASVIGIIAFIPLIYQSTVKKTTSGLTYKWLSLGMLSQFCWIMYGVSNRITPVMMSGFFLISSYIYLSILKYYYEKNGLDSHSQLKLSCNKKLQGLKP
jgi:uncharacterized protein with PQ loop repeat